MKNLKYLIAFPILLLSGCANLDVTPKTAIASGNFFTNAKELEIGLNGLYDRSLWKVDQDYWTDDGHHRGGGGVDNEISRATLNSESPLSGNYWRDLYDGIKRANTLLEEMPKAKANVDEGTYNRIEGEARAIRAYFYSILLTKFGDVPLITTRLQILPHSGAESPGWYYCPGLRLAQRTAVQSRSFPCCPTRPLRTGSGSWDQGNTCPGQSPL